jgi:DMSO/TMAO reductase YedYZ molybdopterin-dependent catalytic subunit
MNVVSTRRSRMSRVAVAFALLLVVGLGAFAGSASAQTGTPFASPAASPVGSGSVQITGAVTTPGAVTVADLQGMTAQTVNVSFVAKSGSESHSFTGVLLWDVLQKAGLKLDPNVKNQQLRMYALITANDGYQTVISLGEIDPDFGNQPVLLAWDQDGKPLTGEDGPVRLVTPGDVKGGRYVYGVVSIEVVDAGASS